MILVTGAARHQESLGALRLQGCLSFMRLAPEEERDHEYAD